MGSEIRGLLSFPYLVVQSARKRAEIAGGRVLSGADGVRMGAVGICVGLQSSKGGGFIS